MIEENSYGFKVLEDFTTLEYREGGEGVNGTQKRKMFMTYHHTKFYVLLSTKENCVVKK